VELLIVIVVIVILAAITVVAYNGVSANAHAAALKADLAQAVNKLGVYRVDNGAWPTSLDAAGVKMANGENIDLAVSGDTYCLAATDGTRNFHVTDSNNVPQTGSCDGVVCPAGYIQVPGNPTLGTNNFCVMKYEAKNDGSGNAVSTATGTPWTNISQTSAISTAAAACSGCHLITEPEWMTIAANVLSVPSNWSGGAVGSGFIYQGHINNNPASALAASTDDTDGLNGMTGGIGGAGANNRRTLTLTNGEAIWDFSGNAYEWTQGVITGAQPGLASDNVNGNIYSLKQWNNGSMNWNSLSASSQPSVLASTPGVSAINSWSSTNGIGQLNSNQNQSAADAFFRGGGWGGSGAAGVLTLYLSDTPSYPDVAVGFRVAQ